MEQQIVTISSKSAGGDQILKMFKTRHAVIGVIHCPAFPGSPRYDGRSMDALIETALKDARAYAEGGVDGLIVENHGDVPFLRPADIGHETTAFITATTRAVIAETGLPTGINILANAPIPALAAASASGALFIRVNQWANAYVSNEGLLDGEAALAMRYRRQIAADNVAIFADSHVKHGAHAITADRTIEELTRDLEFFDADVVIATGQRTGDAVTDTELATVTGATGLPVVVGSGVTRDNLDRILMQCRGVIVGSSLKAGSVWWNEVETDRVSAFMDRARELRDGA
ncbi:BtpA/SgcQ family protein [Oceaniglobus indicus]|uniref:BtpA/SgcQ family protein n=1 Tax=Oceaniglobus indicus TaxID=2047749 RepID=UPI001F4E9F68|nr:BtpA/SgcQ family protein [Oceaniglobus indicus]